MKISLLITFLLAGFNACTYTQNTRTLPYRIGFEAKRSLLKNKIHCSKEFYPLIFGSGFMVVDESLISFE
jgi:hypothetical protein